MFDAGIPPSSFGHFIELSGTRDYSPQLAESGAFSFQLHSETKGEKYPNPSLGMQRSGHQSEMGISLLQSVLKRPTNSQLQQRS